METKKQYSVLIVEDDINDIETVLYYISLRDDLKVCGIANNGAQAIIKINEFRYDLVLLDISLPLVSGMEILQNISCKPCVIFTTSLKEHAVDAFNYHAVDYLVKPYDHERFNDAINHFIRITESAKEKIINNDTILIHGSSKINNISLERIKYIHCNKDTSYIFTLDETIESRRYTLKKYIDILSPYNFLQIHKSYILNVRYLRFIDYFRDGQYYANLNDDDDSKLPIGRTYLNTLKDRISRR